ncbi:hypothetical protein J4423_01855 [Candidatus Pacearchaeota archaeon]|nr:hypothetical protein [Candidatus Pacearchaeota archaeon]
MEILECIDTIINKYHTSKVSGKINASNPCFSGDTKVALVDGRNLNFIELIQENEKGKQNYCYTIQKDGSIGIGKIDNPRMTRKDASVIKVILDNNEEIVCTPDHKFMLRNGNYKEAKDLIINDSLMPLYRELLPKFFFEDKINVQNVISAPLAINHKVNSIQSLNEKINVYDFEVPGTHNFALTSGVFVHNCSEYMFLDDSACNLASINLMKFLNTDGKFDTEGFKRVVDRFITSMDLLVDGSSYPTEKIAQNSHDFRPLGLGYANLGALLMSFGLPYDSDEGRAVSAAITALMCGQAYKASAKIASNVGPFPRYAENRESMLDVIRMHRDHVKDIDVNKMPYDLRYLVNEAWDSWSDAHELGKKYGFRNSQATVLAPTGTIAFMMDCDTTGIEPDISLVKYKVLSGGGMLKMVNGSVGLALGRLGYNEDQVKNILNYINTNDMIEGAPGLKTEHLAIFDCAFKPAKGKRSIHYKGHVLMMAVCQPYISGAISKTINMPESATVEEIMDAYIFAWERGLKAVAIYRENSKRSQPLNTKKTEGEVVKKTEVVAIKQGREPLPQTRKSITHKFELVDHKGFLTVGLYDDGRPGEIFVTMSKQGSTVRGLIDSWSLSMSINLQYGASVKDLFGRFRHQKFEPAGFVRNSDERGKLDESQVPIRVCGLCGGPAKRIGNCAIKCSSCNTTQRSGCGE